MEKETRGRKKLPAGERKKEVRFFIETKYIKGGVKKAAELCKETLISRSN